MEIQYLRRDLIQYTKKVDSVIDRLDKRICELEKGLDERLKVIENWRLVFVAKFGTYSAIALFLGSIISTIAYDWVKTHLL